MFKTRLLSGIVLVIIAFATIFLGGDVLFATLLNHFADPCNGSLCICLSEICV